MKVVGYLTDNGKVVSRKCDRTKANNKQEQLNFENLCNKFQNLCTVKGWKFSKF